MATLKPDLTRVWADLAPATNVVDPDVTIPGKFSEGWGAEVPPFEHFNYLQKMSSQGLAHINEQGIAVWDENTVYPVEGIVKGSDGNIYIALLEQSGNTPVGDAVNWRLLINKSGRNPKSRTEMKAITGLTAGDVVHLSEGDRSGPFETLPAGDYSAEIAADSLEGVYVLLDDGQTLKRRLNGYVTPEMFGWESTLSQANSTIAIQACWDSDAAVVKAMFGSYKAGNLVFPNQDFVLTGKFNIYCAEAPADTHYLAASYKYLNNVAEAQTPISIVPLSGDPRDAVFDGGGFVDHPLVSQSWNSKCAVYTKGGILAGCVDTAETRDGSIFPLSSKVNNRWLIISRGNGGCGFYGRDSARNNGTDGTILPGSQIYGNGDHAVYIEAGAGWDIQCRTYGNGAGIGFDGYGSGTLVHDSYIDDGDGVVAALPETGKTFSAAVTGNAALGTGSVGLLPISNCDINGPVTCIGTGDSAPYGVKSSGNKYRANGYMYHQYFDPARHMISDGDNFSVDDPFRFHNGSSTGKFIVSGAYIKTRGYKISGEFSAADSLNYQVDLYDGAKNQRTEDTISITTPFTMDVPVAPMGNYDLRTFKVFIETRDNWDGARRAFYEGTIVVMSKVVGTNNITASLEDVIVTGGDWSAVPAVSIVDDGAGNATITFTATATSVSGYGKVRVIPG